jgi:hypothetical protein
MLRFCSKERRKPRAGSQAQFPTPGFLQNPTFAMQRGAGGAAIAQSGDGPPAPRPAAADSDLGGRGHRGLRAAGDAPAPRGPSIQVDSDLPAARWFSHRQLPPGAKQPGSGMPVGAMPTGPTAKGPSGERRSGGTAASRPSGSFEDCPHLQRRGCVMPTRPARRRRAASARDSSPQAPGGPRAQKDHQARRSEGRGPECEQSRRRGGLG